MSCQRLPLKFGYLDIGNIWVSDGGENKEVQKPTRKTNKVSIEVLSNILNVHVWRFFYRYEEKLGHLLIWVN